jgi:hypothetical protein
VRRVVFLALVLAAAVVTAATALASASPRAVRASIVAAALAQKSVHWQQIGDGEALSTTNADVNADSGRERYTFQNLGGPRGTLRIRLVDHTVYVQGDTDGLVGMLGISQTQAETYVGQWISIPQGDELYAEMAYGLTLASVVHLATPRGRLKLSRMTSHGTRLLVVRGKRVEAGQFWRLTAHANGPRLPIKFSYEDLDTGTSGRFSKWNEPVDVQPPASSTPIATVRGS